MMQRVQSWVLPIILAVGALGFAWVMLFWQLESLTSGFAQVEYDYVASAASIRSVAEEPLYGPHRLATYAVGRFVDGPLAARYVSVSVTAVCGAILYWLLRRWHTRRMSLLGFVLFLSAPWVLHIGRLGVGQSYAVLSILALLASGYALAHSKRRALSLIAAGIAVGMSVFTPGLIWLVLVFAVWQRSSLLERIREHSKLVCALAAMPVVIALGLAGYAISQTVANGTALVGAPAQFESVVDSAIDVLEVPVRLFATNNATVPALGLGTEAASTLLVTLLAVVGAYVYWLNKSMARAQIITALFVGSIVLAGISQQLPLATIMILVLLVAMQGLTLLLQQWRTVFPRNALAVATGVVAIYMMIGVGVWQHYQHYFVAWPKTEAVQEVFYAESDIITEQ